jgi:hypothetical protein
MRAFVLLCFVVVSSASFAQISIQKVIECAASNNVVSKRFEAIGNQNTKQLFHTEAMFWLNFGQKNYGEEKFNNAFMKGAPAYNARPDADLMPITRECTQLKSQPRSNSNSPNNTARTYCAVGPSGPLGCGLTAAQCQSVVSGLPGMVCR